MPAILNASVFLTAASVFIKGKGSFGGELERKAAHNSAESKGSGCRRLTEGSRCFYAIQKNPRFNREVGRVNVPQPRLLWQGWINLHSVYCKHKALLSYPVAQGAKNDSPALKIVISKGFLLAQSFPGIRSGTLIPC